MSWINRLLGRREAGAMVADPVRPEHRLAVIGDVHGRDDLLQVLLDQLAEEDLDRWIFVGDYIDRGDRSADVLARLQALATGHAGMVCLLGNHEKMMLDFLDDPIERGPRWLRYGGDRTLASYGVEAPAESASGEALERARDRLRAVFPPGTEAWLRARPLSWQSGNLWVVHGAADPDVAMSDQDAKTVLWGHRAFLRQVRADGLWVAHGHTIVDEPTADQGRIAVDTGAVATDRLTAAIVEPGEPVRFIQT